MFSSRENGVSQPGSALTVRSHSPPYRGGAGGGACHLLCAAAPLPFGEGLGVGLAGLGFAATSHLAATTGMYLKHSGFGRLVAEWQQIL